MSRIHNVTPRHRMSLGSTFHALLPLAATQAEISARHKLKPSQRSVVCFEDWIDDAQPDFSRRYRQLCQSLEEQDPEAVEFLDDLIDIILQHAGEVSASATPSARKAQQQRRDAMAAVMTLAINDLLTSVNSSAISTTQIHQSFSGQIENQFGPADPLVIEINGIEVPGLDDGTYTSTGSDTMTFASGLDTVVLRAPASGSKTSELPTLVEAGLRALAYSTRHKLPIPAAK